MVNYKNGKIYAIRAPNTKEIYIGSTCEALSRRLTMHRAQLKMYLDGKQNYLTSFNLLQKEGYYIELIEEFPCDNKEQLNRREGEIIRATNDCINKVIPGRTIKEYSLEYYNINKDKLKEKSKIYRENNREKILEYLKEYRAKKSQSLV